MKSWPLADSQSLELPAMQGLASLKLRQNPAIGDVAAEAFAQSLAKPDCRLRRNSLDPTKPYKTPSPRGKILWKSETSKPKEHGASKPQKASNLASRDTLHPKPCLPLETCWHRRPRSSKEFRVLGFRKTPGRPKVSSRHHHTTAEPKARTLNPRP